MTKPTKTKKQDDDDNPALVEVRVLVACAYGSPNDVVTVPAEAVDDGVRANKIDPHPDAVAYAKTLTK